MGLVAVTPCPGLRAEARVPGRVLVVVARRSPCARRGGGDDAVVLPGDTDLGRAPVVCVLEPGSSLRAVSLAVPGRLRTAALATSGEWLIVTTCERAAGGTPFCPAALVSTDGREMRRYPAAPSPPLVDEQGRVTPWVLDDPRLSPDGRWLVARVRGRTRVFSLPEMRIVRVLPPGVCECAWAPDGVQLACARDTGPVGDCLTEAQLYRYDMTTGVETRLTDFPAVDRRLWWNPFATSFVVQPRVSDVRWAPVGNRVGFSLTPGRAMVLWSPDGRRAPPAVPTGSRCWSHPRVSADATRFLYVADARAARCVLEEGDQVRVMGAEGGDDRLVIAATDPEVVVVELDWAG